MIDEKRLGEIEARAAAATPGPWSLEKPPKDGDGWQLGVIVAAVARGQHVYATPPGGQTPESDRRFVAHAREDVPALCVLARQHFDLRRQLLQLCIELRTMRPPEWVNSDPDLQASIAVSIEALLGDESEGG